MLKPQTATEQALKINGNDYMVWNNLMIAYEGASMPDKAAAARRKAEELADKVVQLKPRDALAQSTLANLYAADKLNDKAMTRIQDFAGAGARRSECAVKRGRGLRIHGGSSAGSGVYREVTREGLRARRYSQHSGPAGIGCRSAVQTCRLNSKRQTQACGSWGQAHAVQKHQGGQ